jgi:hypothetical protein
MEQQGYSGLFQQRQKMHNDFLQLWIFMLALCCFSRSKYAWACKIKREVRQGRG